MAPPTKRRRAKVWTASRRLAIARSAELALIIAVLLTACSSPQTNTESKPTSGMLGLDDTPLVTDRWAEWKPTTTYVAAPEFTAGHYAFDYWVLTTPEDLETTWSVFFSVLDFLRNESAFSPEQHVTINSLMASLEGGGGQLDYTFFVSASAPQEGLAIRYGRSHTDGGTSSMTVVMQRAENSAESFSSVRLWLDAGFHETPRVTVLADHDGKGWRSTIGDGVVFQTAVAEQTKQLSVTPVLTVLQSLWKKTTHSDYVDRAAEPTVRPTLMPEALGLKIHDRTIESVFTDTVFPPRLTLGPNQ